MIKAILIAPLASLEQLGQAGLLRPVGLLTYVDSQFKFRSILCCVSVTVFPTGDSQTQSLLPSKMLV